VEAYCCIRSLRSRILPAVDRLNSLVARVTLIVFFVGVGVLASAGIAAAADEATVVSQLSQDQVYIEEGAETVDRTVINNAIARAETCGIKLYVAVLAVDNVDFTAKDIRSGVGDGTVALFKPLFFDLASNDIDKDRFKQAETIADPVLTGAFAHVAVNQFVEAACSIPPNEESSRMPWLLGLGALAGLIFIGVLVPMIGRGRRQSATTDDLDKRRIVLRDWAADLRAPVTELQGPVAATRSDALATMYNEALAVARESEAEIAAATSEPELDRVEIRVARAWMQLRDIRKAITD